MMKRWCVGMGVCVWLSGFPAWGMTCGTADSLWTEEGRKVPVVLEDSIPQGYIDRLDYYYKHWHAGRYAGLEYGDSLVVEEGCRNAAACSDSLYLARLDAFQSELPL